jgi:hypothetical protein
MDRERHALIRISDDDWPHNRRYWDVTGMIDQFKSDLGVPNDRPFVINGMSEDGGFITLSCSWWEWKEETQADAPPAETYANRPGRRSRGANRSPAVETGSLTFEDAPPPANGQPCGCDPSLKKENAARSDAAEIGFYACETFPHCAYGQAIAKDADR